MLLAGLGFSGGFFIVPINALIQHRPEEEPKRQRSLRAANLLSFVGVGAASGAYYVLTHYLHLGSGSDIFLGVAGDAGRHGLRVVPAAGFDCCGCCLWIAHAHAVPA